jgi:hypothetical protein
MTGPREDAPRSVLSPLDDFPVHQIAEPVRYVATSDRNFYDRYYFNAHRRDGSVFVVAGLGQYPNLGTTDAFIAVRGGDRQHVVRSSRLLGADRMDTAVGPIRVQVMEGLKRLRLVCDSPDLPVSVDLTWSAAIPAVAEPRHFYRRGGRVVSDTMRLAQTGTWAGTLRLGDERLDVQPDKWAGGRDRSWGVRPVGEPEPRGARDVEGSPGFFWIYTTPQFDDFSVIVIVHEDRTGRRILEEAVMVWPESSGRPPESLGRPEHTVTFGDSFGTVQKATVTFAGTDDVLEVQPLTAVYLALGTGYGIEPDWRHGMYHGPAVVQSVEYSLGDEEVRLRSRGLVDHLARFDFAGRTGFGLFEFALLGPNERYKP